MRCPTAIACPPLPKRIYFLILLTRHNAERERERKRERENIQTQLFLVHNAFHVGCRCCCYSCLPAVLTCVRLMLISSRRPPFSTLPLPPSPLACAELTSLCPAQPRNEKLNCVTRSKRVAWQGDACTRMLASIVWQLASGVGRGKGLLSFALVWRDEYLLRALTANYLQVFSFFDIFNWV